MNCLRLPLRFRVAASHSLLGSSSYIFHEVRVPLNTALLAVQNLEGTGSFSKDSDQAIEYAALEGSLQMMSQVLNVSSVMPQTSSQTTY